MEKRPWTRPLKVAILVVVVLVGLTGEAYYSGAPTPYRGPVKPTMDGSDGGFDVGDIYCENFYGEWCFGGIACHAGGSEVCDCCQGCVDTETNENWCRACLSCGQT